MTLTEKYEIDIVYLCQPVKDVAFYDRASTKQQQDNGMRSYYSDMALQVTDDKKWNVVPSDDTRNGGICFLDVCSGDEINRSSFNALLTDGRVDTIVAVDFDRLARDYDTFSFLLILCRANGKNLAIYKNETEMKFERKILNILKKIHQ